jgi:hypothetical protein
VPQLAKTCQGFALVNLGRDLFLADAPL